MEKLCIQRKLSADTNHLKIQFFNELQERKFNIKSILSKTQNPRRI